MAKYIKVLLLAIAEQSLHNNAAVTARQTQQTSCNIELHLLLASLTDGLTTRLVLKLQHQTV